MGAHELENVNEGCLQEEKDSFDLLNFSNDANLNGMNLKPMKELESRLTSTL